MKKTEKLSILISIVLISLLAISAVSAAETDDTPLTETSNDVVVSEPSTNDVQVKDTQDTTTKESSSTDTVKATESGTFTDLNNDINKPFETEPNTNTINLTKDYKYDGEKDTGLDNGITFSTSELNGHTITVDGKGHTISGEGGASIFQIVYKNMDVTLKNLIIENARSGFAAINVNKDTKLTLINVTFAGNHGTSVIENNGTLTIEDSKFLDNSYNINSLGGLGSTLSTWDVIIKNTTFAMTGGFANFENNTVKIINSRFGLSGEYGITAVNSTLDIQNSSFIMCAGIIMQDSGLRMNGVNFTKVDVRDLAIYAIDNCDIFMEDTEFTESVNIINAYNSTIESQNSKFINNTGDVITAIYSDLKIVNGLFEGNDEAILLRLSNATIVGTNFTDNGNGEADYGDTAIGGFNSNINLAEVMFINNTYGAIELLNGNLTIEDVSFINSTDDNAITARIANITINEAYFENNAKAIDFINGALNITDGYFINNTNGAISASKADIIIDGAEFEDNDGSIELYNGTLDVTDTYFINNTDDAIEAEMANIKLDGVYFEDNDGSIDFYNGTLDVTDTYFINNTYGAIGAEMADIFIDGGAFVDNGLAIGLYNGTLDVTDVDFINNTYGAIIAQLANVTVSDSIFKYNGNGKALEDIIAGAIYFDNVDGKLTVFDSEFTNNTAKYGGAIYSNGNTTIDGINTFTNNTANYGGAILISGGNADIMGVFEGNTAKKDGGAIANNKGTVEIIGYFQGNIASTGGAIYNNGFMNITNSIFETNNATGNGGAIYHNNRAEKSLIIKDTTFTNDYAPGNDEDENDQAREIYVKHYNDNSDDSHAHNRIARLTNVNITNTFNYRSNKENEPWANNIWCDDCVYGDYHEYNMVPTFNITVLNNVHNKTVLYITLLDNNGEIISTVAYQWIDDDYTEQRKVLPFTFNVTGDINDLVANGVPYTNGTLSVGEHTITITYGGEDYWFTGDYHRYNIDDAWDYHFQVPKTSVTIKFNVTKTVEELEKEVADEEAIAKDLAAQLKEAKDKVADLEKQLETAKGNASDLDKQLQAAKQQVANLTAQLNATNTELTTTNTELTTTKAALDNANNQINTLTITNNNLQSQLTAANNKADDANAKIKKVKAPKKIKKSKKLKITVTLSKKINGKYVYVIFNGKSYKAKAKKGVAKITIKKSALKKLGGKKIKYQIVYNQSLKNKTVKIKK